MVTAALISVRIFADCWTRSQGTCGSGSPEPKKNGRAGKVSGMRQVRAGGTDQTAGEHDQSRVSLRVAGYKLGRQAGALREASDDDPVRGNAARVDHVDGRLHFTERGG